MLKAIINHECLEKNDQTLIMLKANYESSKLEDKISNITMTSKLEEELCSVHSNNSVPLTSHASR